MAGHDIIMGIICHTSGGIVSQCDIAIATQPSADHMHILIFAINIEREHKLELLYATLLFQFIIFPIFVHRWATWLAEFAICVGLNGLINNNVGSMLAHRLRRWTNINPTGSIDFGCWVNVTWGPGISLSADKLVIKNCTAVKGNVQYPWSLESDKIPIHWAYVYNLVGGVMISR